MKAPDPWANVKPFRKPSLPTRVLGSGRLMPHQIDEINVWRWVARLLVWPGVIVGIIALWALLP